MAEESFPFAELAQGDRTVSAGFFAKTLGMLRERGVVAGLDGELAVGPSAPAALAVQLESGAAFVGASELRVYRHTVPRTLPVAPADPANPRHDLVVLDMDTSTDPDTRRVTALVLTGVPAASPADPPLVQTETRYQLPLARVVLPAGASTVQASNLVDLRTYSGPVGNDVDIPLRGVLDHVRDQTALLCFSDFAGLAPTAGPFDLGCHAILAGTAAISPAADVAGGKISLKTGATFGSWVAVGGIGLQAASPSRNPRFVCRLRSSPAVSSLDAQGWGFMATSTPGQYPLATWRKAMFRSTDIDPLVAVTGDGVTEQITDVSAFHTLGAAATFEVHAVDGGTAWRFLIDGVQVAEHTASLPASTMYATIGVENGASVDVRIDDLDFVYCHQDRG